MSVSSLFFLNMRHALLFMCLFNSLIYLHESLSPPPPFPPNPLRCVVCLWIIPQVWQTMTIWRMPSSSCPSNNNQGMLLRTSASSLPRHFPCFESQITRLPELVEAGSSPYPARTWHNEREKTQRCLPFPYYQGKLSIPLQSRSKGDTLLGGKELCALIL